MQINARATYGLSFGGSNPNIFLPDRNNSSTAESLTRNDTLNGPLPDNREWILYLPKAYHPLLLQSHRANLKKVKEDVNIATSVKSNNTSLPFVLYSLPCFPFRYLILSVTLRLSSAYHLSECRFRLFNLDS